MKVFTEKKKSEKLYGKLKKIKKICFLMGTRNHMRVSAENWDTR